MRRLRIMMAVILGASMLGTLNAADWTQFRGTTGNGIAGQVEIPLEWAADKNLAWKVKLAGSGWAQPVIVGDTVFIASATSDKPLIPKNFLTGVMDPASRGTSKGTPPDITIQWQLSALNATTGKNLWTKTVTAGKPKFGIHPTNSYATETPVADAKRVIVFFGATGTLAAFDHAGTELWKTELGVFPTTAGFGTGSSPVLVNDMVIVQSFSETKADLIAFDAGTGKERWKISRDKPGTSWGTPVVWKTANRTEIVVVGRGMVTSHDPANGKELWRLTGIEGSFSSSAAVTENYLSFGNSGPRTSAQLFVVKAGAMGDITLTKDAKSNEFVMWMKTAAGPGMASPIAADGLLYVLNGSALNCYDLATGEQKYKERLPKVRTIAASPVLVDGRLLIIDEAGSAMIVKAGPKFELLSTSKIDDVFWSSPAIAAKALYIRGLETLYCVRKPG